MQTTDNSVPTASADIFAREENPWRRYFARMVDLNLTLLVVLFIVGIIVGIALALAGPEALHSLRAVANASSQLGTIANILLSCLLWVPIEALFLMAIGTTPGKWIFDVRLRDAHGGKLAPRTAMARAGLVYVQGLGCGIPLVSLFTLISAYTRLKRDSITLWDDRLDVAVIYGKMGVMRMIIAGVAIVLTAMVIMMGVVHKVG